MPTYDYKCPHCGATEEVRHSIAELDAPSPETLATTTCYCLTVADVDPAPGLDGPQPVPTRMQRYLAGAPAFGKIASMSPQQRQQVLRKRSRDHFQKEGREIQHQKLGDFVRKTDNKLGL